jgi:putative transposase
VIDLKELSDLCGFAEVADFQNAHRQWTKQGLENGLASRDGRWSEAIAVGSLAFVETVKNDLGVKATHREVIEAGETYELREPAEAYAGKFTGKNDALSPENNIRWDEIVDDARR